MVAVMPHHVPAPYAAAHNARLRATDGVFESARVAGRGFVSIAEAHAIVTGAHLAQSKSEMARDGFGFLERHGASMPSRYPLIGGLLLVAFAPASDFLLFAKHFVGAPLGAAIPPSGSSRSSKPSFSAP